MPSAQFLKLTLLSHGNGREDKTSCSSDSISPPATHSTVFLKNSRNSNMPLGRDSKGLCIGMASSAITMGSCLDFMGAAPWQIWKALSCRRYLASLVLTLFPPHLWRCSLSLRCRDVLVEIGGLSYLQVSVALTFHQTSYFCGRWRSSQNPY